MPQDAAQLLREALELPEEARAALADSLLNSLDSEIDADAEQLWREEIQRRVESLNNGSVQLQPWNEARARLRNRIQS